MVKQLRTIGFLERTDNITLKYFIFSERTLIFPLDRWLFPPTFSMIFLWATNKTARFIFMTLDKRGNFFYPLSSTVHGILWFYEYRYLVSSLQLAMQYSILHPCNYQLRALPVNKIFKSIFIILPTNIPITVLILINFIIAQLI